MTDASSEFRPLKVVQVVASINRDTGGPAVTVPRLGAELAASGVDATIATLDYPEHGPQTPIGGARLESVQLGSWTRALRGWSPEFERKIAGIAQSGTALVHNHGLWMFPNLYARRAASGAKIPLVISPRGMLDSWSLAQSATRKLVFWQLFEKRNLESAAAFHATSRIEADAIRARGFRQPIAIIPNGVDIPDPAAIPDREWLDERVPAIRGKRILLFMSRLHPKKGIADLLNVWRIIASRHAGWHLLVAGPDLDGYGRGVRNSAADLEQSGLVTFVGTLTGEAKACALSSAEVLVLPTRSENFGLVIAEALAHCTPVLTTRAAPWQELVERQCGWWIDGGEKILRDALGDALGLTPEALRRMGSRGRELIVERYSWKNVARQMQSAYSWISGGSRQPDCVRVE